MDMKPILVIYSNESTIKKIRKTFDSEIFEELNIMELCSSLKNYELVISTIYSKILAKAYVGIIMDSKIDFDLRVMGFRDKIVKVLTENNKIKNFEGLITNELDLVNLIERISEKLNNKVF